MPCHRRFSQPAALDSSLGAGTIGGSTLTGAVPSDLAPVHTALVGVPTDSAPVHTDFAPVSLITLSAQKDENSHHGYCSYHCRSYCIDSRHRLLLRTPSQQGHETRESRADY